MRYSERCEAEEQAERHRLGLPNPGCAFVGVHYAKPTNKWEEKALSLVKGKFPNAIAINVYEVVEFIAEILKGDADV